MDKHPLDIIIVGGSLTGLMHGMVLTRLSHNICILEHLVAIHAISKAALAQALVPVGSASSLRTMGVNRPYSFDSPGFCYLSDDGKVVERRNFELNLTSWTVCYYRLRWLVAGLISAGKSSPKSDRNALCSLILIAEHQSCGDSPQIHRVS